MSQPPWIPPAGGGGTEDDESYRGAHSSSDDGPPPATDDLWGGTAGPWSGGADQPWASSSHTDPWAGAKGGWSSDPAGDPSGPDDAGPAFPVPGAAGSAPVEPAPVEPGPPMDGPIGSTGPIGPIGSAGPNGSAGPEPESATPSAAPADPGAPQPWTTGTMPTGGTGYGPPSYADPSALSAGPAVGEPAFAPGLAGPGEPFRAVRSDAVPPSGPQQQTVPHQAGPQPGLASPGPLPNGHPGQPPYAPQQPPQAPDQQSLGQPPLGQPPLGQPPLGQPPLGQPPQYAPPGYAPGASAPSAPSAAEVYTPAEPPPTPRPPQPELPDSMSEVPQYAARLAPAPLPGGTTPPPGADAGPPPGWGAPPEGLPPGAQFPPPAGPNGGAPAGWPNGGPAHAVGGTPPPPAMPRPEDLLVGSRPRTLEKPATWGWRGRFARMSGGMYKPRPSAAELADRQAKLNAQRGFSRPMTVVVIQPKGGAGKTPTTICVASALGVRRGGYIVGWDNNETRGTLAVRTTNDDNQRTTAWDLLGRLDEFERSEARVGDLGYYMRAQGDAQFDALVSDDNPGNMAQIGEVEFKRIHQVLQRFYRMIIIDTGNNVRSTNWQAAVDHADQIVVVSTYQRDVGYSGSWVLDHLAQTGRDELARDAITVLTASEPDPDVQVKSELIKHFGARTRAVVEVPYDSHIAEGGPIRWDELSEASKRAWTSVAAAITQTLYDRDQRQLAAAGRPGA